MAIRVNSNFEVQSKLYADAKQQFATKAEMAAYNPNLIPNGFITFCDEDNANYQYLDINEVDPELGKWRKFSAADGLIDDTLTSATNKTYSINKIKELIKISGGIALVDVLPDLSDEEARKAVDLQKIYLVPSDNTGDNTHDEYVCVYIQGQPDVYREALVTSDSDYDTWKTEIEDYVTGGGTLADDFATYSGVKTTTTMTEAIYAEMVESINASDTDFSAYEARVTAIIITPATTESWDWELIGSISADNLVFDEFTPNNSIGKVKAGVSLLDKGIMQVLKDMLSVDVPATVTLVGSPVSTTLNEKGATTIADVALTATVTVGTATFADDANVIFKKAGVAISTQAFSKDTLTYTYTDTGANIDDTTEYTVELEYTLADETKTATDKITYDFALPMFYGVSATDTVSDVTTLTKIVSDKASQAITYTANNAYCVFACPDTKSVTSLKDVNGFENIDSWSSTTASVTIGSDAVVYKVYVSNTPVTCTNFSYTAILA